jgi:hypothetical protein
MALSKNQFTQLIKQGELKKLFIQLGWNADGIKFNEKAGDQTFACESIAEKTGFKVVLVKEAAAEMPLYAIRKKLSNAITKRYRENLIIFIANNSKKQIWHYTLRRPGKPTITTETPYQTQQEPELLFQKLQGIFFELEEEDKITIIDVSQRVSDSFEKNAKDVVKKFYREFQAQHRNFLKFIKGIKEQVNQEWYASLMLNRLMFCYFIQKKGFLDGDINYLQNRMQACSEKFGKDRFYSFYRTFLLTLFHKGLGSPSDERTKKEIELLGNIPYLNGGLFDEHALEEQYKGEIEIKDEAFKAIFNFFDEWNWYLDTREHATGNNINPDVIGYIFEQYINDRAQMGAYYTREDITDYISKNCIFPWLVEETARNHAKPFEKEGEFFTMLKNSGDTYIYPAVKHGISWDVHKQEPLTIAATVPANIAKGIDTQKPNLLERRADWNTTAPPEAALPTEIWREVMERRKRYEEVKQTIETGGIVHINDCITYNLNITQIVHDWLANTNDAKAIEHFYKALNRVTILDPTCGSGAFLFAALNLLEPLYESCLMRMRSYVEEEDRQNAADRQTFKNAHKYFREVLQDVQHPTHPNQAYFIYKTIILRNLYGVDIMNEAVEIAKLRLFLKLVATVTPNAQKANHGLEPLPDIDFNIRCGNTLIGFAKLEELEKLFIEDWEALKEKETIIEKMDFTARAYEHFKTIQLKYGDEHVGFKKAKIDLEARKEALNEKLNTLLRKYFKVMNDSQEIEIEEVVNGIKNKRKVNAYKYWKATHQPFHWLAEYYEIIVQNGGFDVIIGNPPYVDFKMGFNYSIGNQYSTISTRNLYPLVMERCLKIGKSKQGYIVPISSTSTEGFSDLQKILKLKNVYVSCFDDRPAHLFDGLDKNTLSIILISQFRKNENNLNSTKLQKWNGQTRRFLFELITYKFSENSIIPDSIQKHGNLLSINIWRKIFKSQKRHCHFYTSTGNHKSFYSRKINSFLQALDFIPEVVDGQGKKRPPSEFKELKFKEELHSIISFTLLNSSVFKWFLDTTSDGSHLNKREIDLFPIDMSDEARLKQLIPISKKLSNELKENSQIRTMKYKHDTLKVQCIIPKDSKNTIDEIDIILSEHFGFTQEETDFIINYDIKYRIGLGKEIGLDNEDDE